MREIVPALPAVVRNQMQTIQELFQKHVVPSYARFDLAFERGEGSYLWDVNGRRYLDLGGGIAVCALGHANPEITQALIEQSRKLVHVSNLYYHQPQGRLAGELAQRIGPGRIFFCNSGAEANEGLFKLARKFGHDEGRFEVLTADNSFHGRTLAAIAATGQAKVKKGFEPMVAGFRQVPFNDLAGARAALSPATAAILIEGIQGEGGITAASAGYLLGLRQLCDEQKLLLLMDEVQCGHFRTGRFQSFQRILEDPEEVSVNTMNNASSALNISAARAFIPDGVAMAKSLGGGFPIGAFWVREPYADLLGAGTHATTYGGSPLGCAVALKILEVVERDRLENNAREMGKYLVAQLLRIAGQFPNVIGQVRGLGLMIGIELAQNIAAFSASDKAHSLQFIDGLHQAGLLAVPSGRQVVRLLPALNLKEAQATEAIRIIETLAAKLSL
jgi:acetylornithine aminotransferase/acetylornithine/N-succinyldiaminopimelate aminotransferase